MTRSKETSSFIFAVIVSTLILFSFQNCGTFEHSNDNISGLSNNSNNHDYTQFIHVDIIEPQNRAVVTNAFLLKLKCEQDASPNDKVFVWGEFELDNPDAVEVSFKNETGYAIPCGIEPTLKLEATTDLTSGKRFNIGTISYSRNSNIEEAPIVSLTVSN